MTCIKPELIQKYIDNETTLSERSHVDEHLKHCELCRNKIDVRQRLTQLLVNSLNSRVDSEISLPAFVPLSKVSGKRLVGRKIILYSLSAASVLFLVVFTLLNFNNKSPLHVDTNTFINHQVDANKPVTKQDMFIKIIDKEGNVTELTLK